MVGKKDELEGAPMKRPAKRDTKAEWIEYSNHLEKNLEKGKELDRGSDSIDGLEALREQRDQLLRANHLLRSRKG